MQEPIKNAVDCEVRMEWMRVQMLVLWTLLTSCAPNSLEKNQVLKLTQLAATQTDQETSDPLSTIIQSCLDRWQNKVSDQGTGDFNKNNKRVDWQQAASESDWDTPMLISVTTMHIY